MTAKERIELRKEQILYRKVGKRYIRATDPWATQGLANGWHLIYIKDGMTTYRETVYPANHELIAAALDMEDKLVDIIRYACKARPSKTKLTPEEKADWDWLIKKHGDVTLHYPSFYDSSREIVKAIVGDKIK